MQRTIAQQEAERNKRLGITDEKPAKKRKKVYKKKTKKTVKSRKKKK